MSVVMKNDYILSCYSSLIWRVAVRRYEELSEILEELREIDSDCLIAVSKDYHITYKGYAVHTELVDDTDWEETIKVIINDESIVVNDTYEIEQFLKKF